MVDRLRKIFAIFSIVAMVVMGLPVHSAKAATLSAGDLIKASGAAVYYYGSDGKRYVFPNEKTYKTWYSDFSEVKTITDAELASIQIGGNVVYRAGTRLAKITTDPKVYAVGPNGTLHWITSEAIAKELYGDNWSNLVDDIPDAFFTNYTYGSDLTSAVYPDGQLVKYAGSSNIYIIEGGEKRLISDEATFTANHFNNDFVITVPDTMTFADGTAVTSAEYADVAQLGGSSSGSGSGSDTTSSSLTATVASTSPASQTLPLGAVGVEVAQFTLSAGSSDVNVDGLVLTRAGLGSVNEIDKVYLYKDGVKLTSGRTLNSSTHTATFTNLGLTVPANGSVTLSVKVDTDASTGGGEHYFEIAGVGDITADADIGGVFPVSANKFYVSTSVNVGSADLESNGSAYSYKVGEQGVEVANFTVYVSNEENGQLESVTLYNSGRDILSNLELYRGSTKVADGVINGDYIRFDLSSPYEIAKGDSAQFIVKADVGGRSTDSATLYVRYKTDVSIKGMTYGYSLNLDNTLGGGSNSFVSEIDSTVQSNTTTVEAGQITFAFNGPVATEVSKNTNDVDLMDFAITAQSDTDVEKATINITATNVSDLENLELVCNDVVVSNWATVNSSNVSTDTWTIPAGGVNCQVRVDVTNSAIDGNTVKATIVNPTSDWMFRDTATGDAVSDIIPASDIDGNQMTIKEASLAVDFASSPATGSTYVPRSADADVAGFLFTAGSASNVKVTNIKLQAQIDDAQDGTFESTDVNNVISVVRLYDEAGNQVGSSESLASDGTDYYVTFDNLDFEIPAGDTIKLTAKVDISSSAPLGGNDDDIALVMNDITAEYGNNGVALTATNNANSANVYQTVTTAGVLTASLYANAPSDQIILMDNNALVSQIKFNATKEDIKVEKLKIQIDEAGSENEDEFASIDLNYTNSAGNSETATAYLVGDTASFTGLDILVPADDSAVVDVIAHTNDSNSADNYNNGTNSSSSSAVKFVLIHDTDFRSVTNTSGIVQETVGSSDVVSNSSYVYDAYPSFAVDETDGTLTASSQFEIGKIYVTANGNKDVEFHNGDLLNIKAYANGATAVAAWTVKDDAGNVIDTDNVDLSSGSGTIAVNFDSKDFVVASGTTKTLHVYYNTSDAGLGDSGDSVSIALEDGSSNVAWHIESDTNQYGDVTGHEISDILFRGNLVGGTYSVN